MRPWRYVYAGVVLLLLLVSGCVHVPDGARSHSENLNTSVNAFGAQAVADAAEDMFRVALVRCALPMMGQVRVPRLIIRYRYDGQRAHIESNDAQLVPRLRGCAMPEAGPTISFNGQVTIWRARDDER